MKKILKTISFTFILFFALCANTRLEAQFITTWITADGQITIPTIGSGYNYTVTWTNLTTTGVGNGTISGRTGSHTITGLTNGSTYSVAITGVFPRFCMRTIAGLSSQEALKLRTIAQWGTNVWTSMKEAFYGCSNLTYTATDNPNLSGVTDLSVMFNGCTNFNGNIGSWNTANVSNMEAVFDGAASFNQNIGNWNTTNVTNMRSMFSGATSFNQNIGNWNTTNVVNMIRMFSDCTNFNGNIGSWNTANVREMIGMFSDCTNFNQNIGNWNIARITNMYAMFKNCTNFNQDIGNWNTANVTDLNFTFDGATSFNQNIGNWNTSNVTDMLFVFARATSFNQNLGNWNTARVNVMYAMFAGATSFNQNLGSWNVTNILNITYGSGPGMGAMLDNTGLSIANYDATLIGWASQAVKPNIILSAVGLKYCASATARATLTSAPKNWTISGDMLFCPCLTISPSSLSNGILGTSYSNTITQTGLITGVPTWTITSGTLPAGLSIASNTGVISGTPTTLGTSNFTIQVGNASCLQSQAYSILISCPNITFANTTTANAVVGTPYTLNTSATGNTNPLTYTISPSLPAGLVISNTTGIISGTPNTSTIATIYTVTASQGTCSFSQNYTLAINCTGFSINPSTLPSGTATVAYNESLSSNLTGSLTWFILPALPTGISLNASTGVISGTSATIVANAPYTISVSNGTCGVSQVYNLAFIVPCTVVTLSPNTLALPTAIVNTAYKQLLTAIGGIENATYAFSTITPLPAGLSLSATGELSGIPTFSTSVTFKVLATSNPKGCIGQRIYTLVILPNPATSLNDALSDAIKVYPNPSLDIFNIDFGGLHLGKSVLNIYDIQGRIVYSSEINNNESTISLENNASGLYLMEINTNKGRILKKLVKE